MCLQGSVPPVMAFHLGSLGFLTPFKFDSYKSEVAKVFEGTPSLLLSDTAASDLSANLLPGGGLQATQPSPSAVG